MKVVKQRYRRRAVSELKPHPKNPRRGDVAAIRESIQRNDFVGAVIVQRSTDYILAGRHRVLAAEEEGAADVPVLEVDVDDETALRIMLADNRTSDRAGYDEDGLLSLLKEIGADQGTLEGTAYDLDAFRELEREIARTEAADAPRDDPVPPPPDEPESRPGEVYELGPHRILCGDALEDLPAVMGDELASLVVTSPPYNQKIDSFKPSGMGKRDPAWTSWVERMAKAYPDSRPEGEYQDEQVRMLDGLLEVTTEDASVFYNHKNRYRGKRVVSPLSWVTRSKWELRQEIVWDRGQTITFNARMFMPWDERIYWLSRGDFLFNDLTEIKSWSTVWKIAPRSEEGVTAPFPLELPRRAILACSSPGDVVLDPYVGSGTTLIAAELTGRRCFGVDVDPRYCDVVRQRYEALVAARAAA